MSWPLVFALIWLVVANLLAIIPSRDNHWRRWENGPWIGLIALAAGASILRWPVRYFGRWVRGMLGVEKPIEPAE